MILDPPLMKGTCVKYVTLSGSKVVTIPDIVKGNVVWRVLTKEEEAKYHVVENPDHMSSKDWYILWPNDEADPKQPCCCCCC